MLRRWRWFFSQWKQLLINRCLPAWAPTLHLRSCDCPKFDCWLFPHACCPNVVRHCNYFFCHESIWVLFYFNSKNSKETIRFDFMFDLCIGSFERYFCYKASWYLRFCDLSREFSGLFLVCGVVASQKIFGGPKQKNLGEPKCLILGEQQYFGGISFLKVQNE